jgi:hypothetical protein
MRSNILLKNDWTISKLPYELPAQNVEQMFLDQQLAFAAFREAISASNEKNKSLSVSLGSLSHSGEWSVFLENELWVVCIGERGVRLQPSFFTSVWDALNCIAIHLSDDLCHVPKISPKIHI